MEANAREYIKNYLLLKGFPRISLHCKLVPVQYREYEYGLLLLGLIQLSTVQIKQQTTQREQSPSHKSPVSPSGEQNERERENTRSTYLHKNNPLTCRLGKTMWTGYSAISPRSLFSLVRSSFFLSFVMYEVFRVS